jgi:hypothetical protein
MNGVFTTVQKKMGVEYEDAKKLADRLDKPPTGSDLLKINFQMVRAMKTKPASRILAKVAPTADETASLKAMETLGATESDKKSTDMTDDKAMNEIWNSGGALEVSDDDAKGRKNAEGKQKKVRKWSVSVKRNALITWKVWDSSTRRFLTSVTSVRATVRNAVCLKASAPPAVGVCTRLSPLLPLRSRTMMEISKRLNPRPVPSVTLLVRDAQDLLSTNVKVALKDSNSETVLASPEVDAYPVRSKLTPPILSVSKMMEPDVKNAKPVTTRTVIDVKLMLPASACNVRRVSPDLQPVPVSSAPKAALSVRTPALV